MAPTIVYEDDQGSIIDYLDDDYLEIRWYDASSQFTGDTFNQRQEIVASKVERREHYPPLQCRRREEAGPHRARRVPTHRCASNARRTSRLPHCLLRHPRGGPSMARIGGIRND